jgi:Ran GTPase-activating protein (RanGAP) involved in mRNA processing and transport
MGSLKDAMETVEVLKLSGTKISEKTLLELCQRGANIRWLEISHLEELELSFMGIKQEQHPPEDQ